MTKHDTNGFRIKPGHDGERLGHQTGPYRPHHVWIVRREDDKLWGYWRSRHAAVGALATEEHLTRTQRREWFDVVRVPVGSVRPNDVIKINETEIHSL